MKSDIYYRKAKIGDEEKICKVIIESFNKYVGIGYSSEGRDEFYRFVNPSIIRERLEMNDLMTLALVDQQIVGVIAMRNRNHISLLFVDDAFHRRGIGKKLLMETIKLSNVQDELTFITVNSSPYAIEIYKKLGFEITNIEQEKNGIAFIPMRMAID